MKRGEVADNIPYKLRATSGKYRAQFDLEVQGLGLTRSQWWLVVNIFHYPGINQKQLAEKVEINRSAAGAMLHKLEDKGWVVRRVDEANNRAFILELAPKVLPLLDKLFHLSEILIEESLSDLTAAEIATLHRALDKISGHLEKNTPSQSKTVAKLRKQLEKDFLAVGKPRASR
jgi:DNA-binding MarR family transcriptional regulator